MSSSFTTDCKDCPRLAEFISTQKEKFPDYYCKPVAAFGDPKAQFLIVGLAPGLHGANATVRPFTVDHAGILLYQTLHQFGFSSHATSVASDDDLSLINTRITNAVKCVPPQNKPTPAEIKTCNRYLQQELNDFVDGGIVLALGRIAHEAVIRALGLRQKDYPFAHAAEHQLPQFQLLDSYHCSRYNTQTKRLTSEQFAAVFATIKAKLNA